MLEFLKPTFVYFLRPIVILKNYPVKFLSIDLMAGLTVAAVALPQGIAFALMAQLPVQMGLYATIIASVVACLWGSSHQLQTGPTNAASLLVLSILTPIATPGSPDFIMATGLLAVMSGIIRVLMGIARLGVLVNFVSDSVIVGFTAGAGMLIAVNELKHLFRIAIPNSTNVFVTLKNTLLALPAFHWQTLCVGLGTLVLMIAIKRFAPKLPTPMLGIALATALVGVMGLNRQGVPVLGEFPRGLPPLAHLPLFNLDLIGRLSTGALVVAAIGLVEATSIARSISSQTGQRLDSNQEFVGQGLANIACGFFSGYPVSGSFNRSALSYAVNAQTAVAGISSGIFVLIGMVLLAPFIAYIPRTALAAVLLISAYGMIDRKEILRILRGTRGDTIIMTATLLATIFLPLEFAVLTGILFSFARYAVETSIPHVQVVMPDDTFSHLIPRPDKPFCPQLVIVDVLGDLYFGAVNHVEEIIRQHMSHHPEQRFLLLRMRSVNHCDISGIHMLESLMRGYRELGGDMYLMRVSDPVREFMLSTGFAAKLGSTHFLTDDNAVSYLYQHILDPAVCVYECEARVFFECQNLPKQTYSNVIPLHTTAPTDSIFHITPKNLHQRLADPGPVPLVVDVREPREYRQGHIPQSKLIPFPQLLTEGLKLPLDRQLVLVCRGGRRSTRAAYFLQQNYYNNVCVLQGGMLAWEAAGFLQAIEQ